MSEAKNPENEKSYRALRGDEAVMERREQKEEIVCPSCGVTMEEYLQTGLVGCVECYRVFERELIPYICRIQGCSEHGGKEISRDGKYEAAQSLRAASRERQKAIRTGNASLAKKMERKEAELKLILFGDDEEE